MANTVTINWIDATAQLPDADLTVLIATSDGEVVTGFFDEEWRDAASAMPTASPVTHWADLPEPPAV